MIREAGVSDIPQLLEWGKIFTDRAGFASHVGWNPADVEVTVRAMIDAPEHVIFISENGMIGALSVPHPFNRAHIIGEELFWWSQGRDGLRLLAALEEWAKARCHSLRMVTIEAIEPERTGRLYERLGFAPLEHGYIKVF